MFLHSIYKTTNYVKCNKTRIIKHTACQVPAPTCFGIKVSSSGSIWSFSVIKQTSFPGANLWGER